MKKAKGGPNRFAALPARDVRLVQVSHLQQRFELAPRSQLAEAVADRVNEVLAEHEADTGTRRLEPGELLVEIEGELTPFRCSRQSGAGGWLAVSRPPQCGGIWSMNSCRFAWSTQMTLTWRGCGGGLTRKSWSAGEAARSSCRPSPWTRRPWR